MFKNLFNKGNNESTSNSVEKVAQKKFSYYNYITEEMKSPEYVFDAEDVLEGLDEDEIDGWNGVEIERVTYQLMTQYIKEGVNIEDNYWDIKTEAENQVNPIFQQYKIAHSLELNGFVASGFAQEGWYIETPKDANGNLLVAVVYEQLENGDISVKTYDYMLNKKGRIVADTETPLDIPENRWIDIRLQELPQPESEVTDDPEQ